MPIPFLCCHDLTHVGLRTAPAYDEMAPTFRLLGDPARVYFLTFAMLREAFHRLALRQVEPLSIPSRKFELGLCQKGGGAMRDALSV
jgi:hypothetical protein